ncbi:MAG: hypothetical protein FIB08_10735 [Candidatus Methanoperedens sp.]|nr:hypothetical protein [Candidatus Methanoperedens sp.]
MSAEMLRKMGLFGIGIISLTQEKLDEFTQDMIKKGEMSREEGKKFVREVLSEKEKQVREIEDKINEKVKKTVEDSGIAMKSDLAALEKKVEELEETIKSMSNR